MIVTNFNQSNLWKLKIDTPWKYAFFVDVTFESFKDYEKAKSVMKIMAEEFKELELIKMRKYD